MADIHARNIPKIHNLTSGHKSGNCSPESAKLHRGVNLTRLTWKYSKLIHFPLFCFFKTFIFRRHGAHLPGRVLGRASSHQVCCSRVARELLDLFNNMLNQANARIFRTLVVATVVTSCAVYGGFLSYAHILFYLPYIYGKFPPQIWRTVTSFWLTGPQMGLLFDPFFLWTYGSALEIDSPRFARKGDFFVYTAFLHVMILVSLCCLSLSSINSLLYCCLILFCCLLRALQSCTPLKSARAASSSCKRFLKLRKITLAVSADPSFAIQKGSVGVASMVGQVI